MPNAYASKICAGKIKDPSGVKRKDFRGPKPAKAEGGRVRAAGGGLMEATERLRRQGLGKGGIAKGCGKVMSNRRKVTTVY